MKELIIDINWLWINRLYAFKDLTNADGIPTGGFYGVLKFHEAIANKGYQIVACLDGYPKERKELSEDYKDNRESDDFRTLARKCNQAMFEVLNFLGWKFYKNDNLEADDLIAMRAIKNANSNVETIIYSGDKDLCQLMMYPQIKVSNKIEKNNFVFRTNEELIDKVGCTCNLLRYYRPFRGDSSDNIKAATPRIQSKILQPMAKSIENNLMLGLTLNESYKKAIADNSDILTAKSKQTLIEGEQAYCINFQLMDLLKWHYQEVDVDEVNFRKLSETDMLDILKSYNMKEFIGNYIDNKVISWGFRNGFIS